MIKLHTSFSKPDLNQKSLQSLQQLLERKDLGFFQVPSRTTLWTEAQEKALELRRQFKVMVVIGIGGSSLGPRAIKEIFQSPDQAHQLHFLDNVDPIDLQRVLKSVGDLEKACWVIISKSGTTMETLVAAQEVISIYHKKNLPIRKHFRVVTEPVENPLSQWAATNNVESLELPIDVGGRFSVLTAVGMLPAAFIGLDIEKVRQGALTALQDLSRVSEMMSQTIQSWERQEWITFFWFYSSLQRSFGGWVQQLWAESLAKVTDNQGQPAPRVSTPIAAIGTCDQHSLLQQVMEGTKDKFVVFIRSPELESAGDKFTKLEFAKLDFMSGHSMGELLAAEAMATQRGLKENSVSTMSIESDLLTPQSLGYNFMFWELVVAGLGQYLDINAFNQPGVELGKRLARELLSQS